MFLLLRSLATLLSSFDGAEKLERYGWELTLLCRVQSRPSWYRPCVRLSLVLPSWRIPGYRRLACLGYHPSSIHRLYVSSIELRLTFAWLVV